MKTRRGSGRWQAIGAWFIVRYMPEGDYLYLGTVNQRFTAILTTHAKGLRLYLRDRRKHDSPKSRTIIIPGEYRLSDVVDFLIAKTGVNEATPQTRNSNLNHRVPDWRTARGRRMGRQREKLDSRDQQGTKSFGWLLRYRDLMKTLKASTLWERRGRLGWTIPKAFFRVVPLNEFARGSTRSPRAWWQRYIANRLSSARHGHDMRRLYLSAVERLRAEGSTASVLDGVSKTLEHYERAEIERERAFDRILGLTLLDQRLGSRACREVVRLNEEAAQVECGANAAGTELARAAHLRLASRLRTLALEKWVRANEQKERVHAWVFAHREQIEERKRRIATTLLPLASRRRAEWAYRLTRSLIAAGIFPESPATVKKWIALGVVSSKREAFIEDLLLAFDRGWVRSTYWGMYAAQLHEFYRDSLFEWHKEWCAQSGVSFDEIVRALLPLASKTAARALHRAIKAGMPASTFVSLGARSASDIEFALRVQQEAVETAPGARPRLVTSEYRPPVMKLSDGWEWATSSTFYGLGEQFHNCISEQRYYERTIAQGVAHVVYRPDRAAVAFLILEEVGEDKLMWQVGEAAAVVNGRVADRHMAELERITAQLNVVQPQPNAPLREPQAITHGSRGQRLLKLARSAHQRHIVSQICLMLRIPIEPELGKVA